MVELAGTPRAGKTTAVNELARMLREQRLRVRSLTEQASTCPIECKREPTYNVWTYCSTLMGVLEAQDRGHDLILVDRGLFDSACWMHWHMATNRLSPQEHRAIQRFVLLPRWADLTDLVIVMEADPPVAMKRELAQRGPAHPSQIINERTLREFNDSLALMRTRRKRDLPLIDMDTSRMTPDDVLSALMRKATEQLRLGFRR